MGRKTYESLPRPLLHRYHLVVSESWDSDPEATLRVENHGEVVGSLSEAMWDRVPALVHQGWHPEVMIIGGGTIYHQALPLTNRAYLTTFVDREIDGDTYFPFLTPEEWGVIHLENANDQTMGAVKFAIYQRNNGLVHP